MHPSWSSLPNLPLPFDRESILSVKNPTTLVVMKFVFLDSFLVFTFLSSLSGLIILTFYLRTTFLILTFLLTSHQRREPRTTRRGITRGWPTQTGLQYDLHLLRIRNPQVRT